MNTKDRVMALLCIEPSEVRKRLAMRRRSAAVAALSVALLAQPQLGQAKTDVFATFRDDATAIGVIASLLVPPGRYVINAKASLNNDNPAKQIVTCTLDAGADFDENTVRLQPNGGSNADRAVIAHQLVHEFSEPFGKTIFLSCLGENIGAGLVKVRFAKITAIRIDGSLSNVLFD